MFKPAFKKMFLHCKLTFEKCKLSLDLLLSNMLSVLRALSVFIVIFALFTSSAQANIFEQFFGGGGGGPQHQQQQQSNAPSDSNHYRNQYFNMPCDKYLCPDTLACVHFPHHCPCAFSDIEDKVELGEGSAVCASKGGFKQGEMARKVELARQGLL